MIGMTGNRNRCPKGTRLEARFTRGSKLRQFQSGNQLYSEDNPDDAGFISNVSLGVNKEVGHDISV